MKLTARFLSHYQNINNGRDRQLMTLKEVWTDVR